MMGDLALLRPFVLGPDGHNWLDALFRLQIGERPERRDILALFVSFSICYEISNDIRLTPFGLKCADSAREYIFWTRRKRRFHGENELDELRLENFRGKDLLEIGAGCGTNLMRLSQVCRSAIGLEIEPLYVEFSQLLAEKEQIGTPRIIIGRGECSPFPPASFDWLLLWSSLQYMEINQSFKECVRLLRANGKVLISVPLFGHAFAEGAAKLVKRKSIRTGAQIVFIILDMLLYQSFPARLRRKNASATSAPLFMTKSFIIATAKRAGLSVTTVTVREDRCLFVFTKDNFCYKD